jgi:hypothetical protein
VEAEFGCYKTVDKEKSNETYKKESIINYWRKPLKEIIRQHLIRVCDDSLDVGRQNKMCYCWKYGTTVFTIVRYFYGTVISYDSQQ